MSYQVFDHSRLRECQRCWCPGWWWRKKRSHRLEGDIMLTVFWPPSEDHCHSAVCLRHSPGLLERVQRAGRVLKRIEARHNVKHLLGIGQHFHLANLEDTRGRSFAGNGNRGRRSIKPAHLGTPQCG